MRERTKSGAALAVCCLLLLLAAAPLTAQITTSAITGVVRDKAGEPVVGAVVEARSEDTGALRSAVTDVEGRYRIDLLNPGAWVMRATSGADQISESRAMMLRLHQTVQLDFTMGAGHTEEVTVLADNHLVDPTRTSTELRVGKLQVDTLPVKGRDVTELAKLDSAVRTAAPGNFFGERGSAFIINGQTGRSNSFLVDGLDNNDHASGTNLNASFSQEVVREMVVLTSQYAAEFGRASGGILNIITERGGNEAKASFFVQGSPREWNDPGEFITSLPPTEDVPDTGSSLQTGFKMGGPFRKDKAFYFLAYEHQNVEQVIGYTGIDRDGTIGGRVRGPYRDDNVFARFDFNLGRHFLMTRVSWDERETEGLNIGGIYTPESGFRVKERDLQVASTLTSVVTDAVQNEARFLFGHSSFDQLANSARPGVQRPSGIFGGNNLYQQFRDEDRFQFVDNVTLRFERHTMKFGFDVILSRTDLLVRFNPNGNFLYDTDRRFEPGDGGDLNISDVARFGSDPIPNPGVVGVDDDGDGLIDEPGLIDTYPVVYQYIMGQPDDTFNDTYIAFFAQDSWQIGPRIFVNYGLRYDMSTYTLPDDAGVDSIIPNGGAGRDYDNLAPRIGFTFKPRDSNWLVRGGAGVFYDKLVLAFPAVAAVTSQTEIGLIFPQGLALEITEDVIEEEGIENILPGLIFPEDLIMRFSTATVLETPYTIQYGLGTEGKIGRGIFKADLVRALGYHVPLMRDLNPVVGTDALGIPVHRDPDVGSITAITTEGRSWYSGLNLSWQWSGRGGWYSAAYTLSKAEDTGPDPLKGGIYLPPDSDDLSGERGRADSDRRHRLVLAGEGRLPWGLRLSGILELATGSPFNVTTGGDENLDGITTDRPVGVDRNTGADTPLDPVNALREEHGLEPVTELREPRFAQLDLRLAKDFQFADKKGYGQFFLQVLNVTDKFNWGLIEGRATSINFGQPIGQLGPPRTYEIGLRIGF